VSLSGVDRSKYFLPPKLETGGIGVTPEFVRLVDA
jgi:hypothetical protein